MKQCLTCALGKLPNDDQNGCEKPPWKQPFDCTAGLQFLNDTEADKLNWVCQDCPDGGDCSGNLRWSQVVAKPGYHRMSYDDEIFGQCLNQEACSTDNNTDNNTDIDTRVLRKYEGVRGW